LISTLINTVVLVTGISGFIGSHLAHRLIAEGASVHGLVRNSSDLQRIQDIKELITLHYSCLEDFESLRKSVKVINPKKIIHLAAHVDVRQSPAIIGKMIDTNIKGTSNLLQALEEIDYDCFINTGSAEEYGNNQVPFHEDQKPNPISPYSITKVASTMLCQMLFKYHGFPIVTLRPFLTYGPAQKCNMLIPLLISKTLREEPLEMTKGEQTREFNYVDDIVDGLVRASVCPAAIGQVINLGSGQDYNVRAVVEMILRAMGSTVKPKFGVLDYRPGEPFRYYCDNKKAREILHWKPQIDLEEGLNRTIAWYRQHNLEKSSGHR